MYQTFYVRILDADNYCVPIETVQRSLRLGVRTLGWVSYRGQRCQVTMGNVGGGAHFEAMYYPSRGRWR